MANSKTTVVTAAAAAVKPATKAEAAYVTELSGFIVGVDVSAKELMLCVNGLADKCGKRALDLVTFAYGQAYGAESVPRQRLSQARQFCAMPSAQRAELIKHYGTIATCSINRATVSPAGKYTAPVKKAKGARVNAGHAKDAGGTPLLTAQPSTVIASVMAQLEGMKAKLTKPQLAVLAGVLADFAEFAEMLDK